MDVAAFDYELPPDLIAQEPHRPRDHSRLLVVRRAGGAFEHRRFFELEELLRPGDMLVLNNTRVIRARLLGRRESGGRVELLLLKPLGDGRWEALIKPGRAGRMKSRVHFDGIAEAEIISSTEYGGRLVQFSGLLPEAGLLDRIGQVPTPPYITRPVDDSADYQTVYAQHDGSAAAPTAGFHFTQQLLERLRQRGVEQRFVTLHVGLDTFRPIKSERLEEHDMHSEHFTVPVETAAAIRATRVRGGRVVAVGTTTVRALESAAQSGEVSAGCGWTRLFIRPGYVFRGFDALLTNFHLPRSTLLVLVSALAGRERILAAYREAIEMRYRFYSFGDAMLIA